MVEMDLTQFLKKYPKTENGKHTHIVYAPSPGRSYTIPNDKIDEFYSILSKSLFIKKDKISIISKPIRATYNMPLTPPPFRRNEVMFRIKWEN